MCNSCCHVYLLFILSDEGSKLRWFKLESLVHITL
jgi:hypothetical protein